MIPLLTHENVKESSIVPPSHIPIQWDHITALEQPSAHDLIKVLLVSIYISSSAFILLCRRSDRSTHVTFRGDMIEIYKILTGKYDSTVT